MKITAPNKDFIGKRAGVAFIDGVGETDDPNAIAYFKRHGYELDDNKKPARKAAAPKGDAEQ